VGVKSKKVHYLTCVINLVALKSMIIIGME